VAIECAVLSTDWMDVAALVAADLSPLGMWLDSDLPLEAGSEVVVSFTPPRWPVWGAPVTVLAEVVRVGLPRRRADCGSAGMGLRFLDLDPQHAARLALCLRGMPPMLPSLRAQRAERSEEQLVLGDGTRFELRAEAPLLSIGRSPEPAGDAAAAAEPTEPVRRRGRPRTARAAEQRAGRGSKTRKRKPALRLAS
jgi:hypothetical protein